MYINRFAMNHRQWGQGWNNNNWRGGPSAFMGRPCNGYNNCNSGNNMGGFIAGLIGGVVLGGVLNGGQQGGLFGNPNAYANPNPGYYGAPGYESQMPYPYGYTGY